MSALPSPLTETQLNLLRLTTDLSEAEQQQLKQLIIAFKAQRLARLADAVWEEKGWNQQTMDAFLAAHMRTSHPSMAE